MRRRSPAAQQVRRRAATNRRCRDDVALTIVAAKGFADNAYARKAQNVRVMDDLFNEQQSAGDVLREGLKAKAVSVGARSRTRGSRVHRALRRGAKGRERAGRPFYYMRGAIGQVVCSAILSPADAAQQVRRRAATNRRCRD